MFGCFIHAKDNVPIPQKAKMDDGEAFSRRHNNLQEGWKVWMLKNDNCVIKVAPLNKILLLNLVEGVIACESSCKTVT